MRVLFGLAALAASVNGASVTITNPGSNGSKPVSPPVGAAPMATITCREMNSGGSLCQNITPAGSINNGQLLNTGNWAFSTSTEFITTLVFTFATNQYTGQMQYRWYPDYPSPAAAYPGNGLSAISYTCDSCDGSGTPISCNTAVGPGAVVGTRLGYDCSRFTRIYTFNGLVQSSAAATIINSFSVQIFDIQDQPAPNVTSYSFQITRIPNKIVADPMIYGIQGQDFQVHGIPDEIFNMISAPTLQVNARFVYLSSAECIDNFTACFAHPGTYISEEGIRLGADKVHIKAGSAKKGLSVKINGQKMSGKKQVLKSGEVMVINHRRVVVKHAVAEMQISNSDHFLNQETIVNDRKLIELGAARTKLLVGESFHPEVPLHGLQGQTWRNVEYPTGLEYEGSISDYHVTDGNLFGSSFVFNKYNPAQN